MAAQLVNEYTISPSRGYYAPSSPFHRSHVGSTILVAVGHRHLVAHGRPASAHSSA